jgi:hypothetical protein
VARDILGRPLTARRVIAGAEHVNMLEEKLREAVIGELKRQAANRPDLLRVQAAEELSVDGMIDLDALIMVIAGSVAGGP